MKKIVFILVVAFLIILGSCSKSDDSTPSDNPKTEPSSTPFLVQAGVDSNVASSLYDLRPSASTIDNDGNIYVTGSFSQPTLFGTTTLTSTGNEDLFIAKYDTTGKLLWAKHDGGISYEKPTAIQVGTDGFIYIAGSFSGNSSIAGTSLTGKGQYNVFVAKYSSSGDGVWASQYGKATDNYGLSVASAMAMDKEGNFYITGYFYLDAQFGNTSLTTLQTDDSQHFFVTKINANREVAWVNYENTQNGGLQGYTVTSDASGNVYAAGNFSGTITLHEETFTTKGQRDIIVVKYNSSGAKQWIKQIGGTDDDFAFKIKTDTSGNFYMTGILDGTIDFGVKTLTAGGGWDMYLLKGNSNGNIQWVSQANTAAQGNDLTLDASGSIYVTGYFNYVATFESKKITTTGADAFAVSYTPSGQVLWAKAIGATNSGAGDFINVDKTGNVFVTGEFTGSLTANGTTVTSAQNRDVFISKFKP